MTLHRGTLFFLVAFALMVGAVFFRQEVPEICPEDQVESFAPGCLDPKIELALRNEGIVGALDTLALSYQKRPQVHKDCFHDTSSIGILAYLARGAGSALPAFPPQTAYCEYGFFYGYLGALFRHQPDTKLMTETCEALRTSSGTLTNVVSNCYRIAGRALAQASLQRSPSEDIIAGHAIQALEGCARTGAKDSMLEQCQMGVFHFLSIRISGSGLSKKETEQSLFSLCDNAPKSLQKVCYFEIGHQLVTFSSDDPRAFSEALAKATDDPTLYSAAFRTGVGTAAQRRADLSSQKTLLDSCMVLELDTIHDCVIGIVHAIFTNGELRTAEAGTALSFCAYVSEREPRALGTCYAVLMDEAQKAYTSAEARSVCEKVPEVYQSNCVDRL